jgi:putative colanic acid biosynthesis acetyltransferase WcaF
MGCVKLSSFENNWYRPGRSRTVRALWFFLGLPLLRCSLIPFSCSRRSLLLMFGARIGKGAVIKPGVRVKYPWLFQAGDDCWIGEDCWIDNLASVTLGDDVCISQGVYFCTGNHDWSDPSFRLIVKPISVQDGAWIGAKAVVGPGTIIGEGAVVATGAVATKNVPAYEIHAGSPARFVRRRALNDAVAYHSSPVRS